MIERGALLSESADKLVWEAKGKGGKEFVIIELKGDAPSFGQEFKKFETKATYDTSTTCKIFSLLRERASGLPVAYVERISSTEFLSRKCQCIPLKVIVRRYSFGKDFLQRKPHLCSFQDGRPVAFHKLVVEFFLQTVSGRVQIDGRTIVDVSVENGAESLLILNPHDAAWSLSHPQKPLWDKTAVLAKGIDASHVLSLTEGRGNEEAKSFTRKVMRNLDGYSRNAFLIIEGIWNSLGRRLVEVEMEFGMTAEDVMITGLINNNTWEVREFDWRRIRSNPYGPEDSLNPEEMSRLVSELIGNFRVPEQFLVLWGEGSFEKELDYFLRDHIIMKGENSSLDSPVKCLRELMEAVYSYPDGGVILVKSKNVGLGAMLAKKTSWPVISVPIITEKEPEKPDYLKNLEPPKFLKLSDSDGILLVEKILSQRNPFAYQRLQRKIEELDD